MSQAEDYSPTEIAVVQETLFERYKRVVNVELADAELRLDPDSSTMTSCPTLFWQDEDVSFVVFKLGRFRYRSQFFYGPTEQFGTGREEYDDLGECLATLLRLQADHQRERAGIKSGSTGADLIN